MTVAHLIGGGPSAADLDTASLSGLVIGINDAGLVKPCHAWFTLDHRYALEARSRLLGLPSSVDVHVCAMHRNFHHFEHWRARLWRRVHTAAPCLAGDALSSGPPPTPGCSGYAAINLAAALGAREIYLHGYDFGEPYRYFFNSEPFPRKLVPDVVRSFTPLAREYERLGIRVINCNPESKIRAFDFQDKVKA